MRFYFVLFFSFSILFSTQFCISTYNVENLFDDKIDGTEYKEFIPSKYGWSKEEADNKFANTLQVLKDLNSSIYALQEIENESILIRLKNALEFEFHAFSKNPKSATGIGIISKYKITKIDSYMLKGYEKFRPILHVKIEIDKKELDFFINHWPSLKNEESTRIAFAKSLKFYIKNQDNNDFIVLGDFNTAHEFNSIVDKNFGDITYDPWYEISEKKRWSHVYKGSYDALDRILISNQIENGKNFYYVKGSFKPFSPEFLLNTNGHPKGNFRGYSDHLPLVACFSTEKNDKNINFDFNFENIGVLYIDNKNIIVDINGTLKSFKKPKTNVEFGKIYKVKISDNEIKEILNVGENFDYQKFDKKLTDTKNLKENDILINITGVYKRGKIVGNFGEISFFRLSNKPSENEKLFIKRARVQKYKNKLQIVAP